MKSKITVFIFLSILMGFSIASIIKKPASFSEQENRYLSQKPKFSVDSLINGKYAHKYEEYLADQFLARNSFITLKSITERLLLKQDMNGVYFGKDSYLIEKHDADKFETELASQNILRISSFINEASREMGEEHVKLLAVPTASEILLDKLPLFASPYAQSNYINAFDKYLTSESEKQLIDATSILSKHNDEYIFYKTDHHWTTLGAYYGYELFAESMKLLPLKIEDFKKTEVSNSFYGTLEAKINISVKPDTMYKFEPLDEFEYEVIYNGIENDMVNSLYNEKALNTKDKYTYYLNGNNPLVQINTKANSKTADKFLQDKTILIIKDSFAHCFVPFIANHYQTTFMIDLRYFNMNIKEFINENAVDDILILYNTVNMATDKNISKLKYNN